MTKQEQIEELKNILLKESNSFYGLECDEACSYCEASAVYKAGYRKADEVRKETAKEIFEKLEKLTYRLLNDADYTMGDIVYDITELKNKYTGEKEDANIH